MAAWTVPVVTAIGTAPVFASTPGTSSASPGSSLFNASESSNGKQVIDIGAFTNTGTTPTGTLTITFTLLDNSVNTFDKATVTAGTGWVASKVSNSVVQFVHAPLAAGQSTPAATFTGFLANSGAGTTIVGTWNDSLTTANPDGTLFSKVM